MIKMFKYSFSLNKLRLINKNKNYSIHFKKINKISLIKILIFIKIIFNFLVFIFTISKCWMLVLRINFVALKPA